MSSILRQINCPADVKGLSPEEVSQLAQELRTEILDRVSTNGGHLASNLGVVDLVLAICRTYDFRPDADQIIFDVGHQAYAWKLVTGRREDFSSLRQRFGLSGFPKRSESQYDAFNTGHASTSISAGLGLARAKKIKGESGSILTITGDGAMGGGMIFEALNDACENDNITVILNDNQMSIDKNVGALSKALGELRIKPDYQKFKRRLRPKLKKHPKFLGLLRRFKSLDRLLYRKTGIFFESLNWRYYGPVDGHDIPGLERHLKALKDISGPKILHVYTVKGLGYAYAEEEPESYHGVGSFKLATGLSQGPGKQKSFSELFGQAISNAAEHDPRICAITAAMTSGTGLDHFANQFPSRFYDVGIAEQHATCLAAGLAAGGLRPVLALYSTFLQRAFDQLIHDIDLQNLPVLLAIDRAGLVPFDGETHQGIHDLSILANLANFDNFAPRDVRDIEAIISFYLKQDGPVSLRYPKTSSVPMDLLPVTRQIKSIDKVDTGDDYTVLALGTMLLEYLPIIQSLKSYGLSGDLFSTAYISQELSPEFLESCQRTGRLVVLSESLKPLSYGAYIGSALQAKGISVRILDFAIEANIDYSGSRLDMLSQSGLSALKIQEKLIIYLKKQLNK